LSADFSAQLDLMTDRITEHLDLALPKLDEVPARLHEAMRYSVLNGGKRVRPLLVYATGLCLAVAQEKLDAIAVAIELMHAFSLVHDDLPAMDDDDLRRGMPTVHRQFDEATAILAADALQPLAFRVIAESPHLSDREKVAVVRLVAIACGSQGMTGGQSIDLASEGKTLSARELRTMHSLKTGALLGVCVMSVCELVPGLPAEQRDAMRLFADAIGLAFQIRDDILDIEGETSVIGKSAGADERMGKATWPALFGIDAAREMCQDLLATGLNALSPFGEQAVALQSLARYIVERPK